MGDANVAALRKAHVGLVAHAAHDAPRNDALPQADAAQRKPLGHKLGRAPRTARLVSVDDAAVYLGISRRAVWRLIASGALARVTLPGQRRVLLDVNDLAELVSANKDAPLRNAPVHAAPARIFDTGASKTLPRSSTNR